MIDANRRALISQCPGCQIKCVQPAPAGIERPGRASRHDWRGRPEVRTAPGYGERRSRRVVVQRDQSVGAGNNDVGRRVGRGAEGHSAVADVACGKVVVRRKRLPTDTTQAVDADDVANALLADDEAISATKDKWRHGTKIDIETRVVVPVGLGEAIKQGESRRQSQHALRLVGLRRTAAVSGRTQDVAGCGVNRECARAPERRPVDGRIGLKADQGLGAGIDPENPSVIGAAVAVAAAKWHVDISVGQRQRAPLPVVDPVQAGRRQFRLRDDGAGCQVQRGQVVIDGSANI